MTEGKPGPRTGRRLAGRLTLLVALALALTVLALPYRSNAAPVSITVPYSSTPVADADLDGTPGTGAWGDALSVLVPLENGEPDPYGSATLYAKHDGTFYYFRIDGKIDTTWTSAAGNHFWLGIQFSPTGTSHHSGGTWDGAFFGLWDGTDYAPQPTYPPSPVDTNGFARPPVQDATQDGVGKMRYTGSAAPYDFTAEWKKRLNTGDASDIAYAADGTTPYNFFVTTDSNGRGSQGGNIDHSSVTNTNSLRFAPPSAPNTPPTVDLTSPNGGEVWTGGSAQAIRWNMSDAETATTSLKVWINYSTDGGVGYSPISGAQGISGISNPASYSWTLPTISTSQGRVRVTVLDAKSASATDASLANFVIDSSSPTVTAFVPSDGASGISTSTQVRVSFSEAMNRNSAEQAFSLRRLDTSAYVVGSFSWSGNDLVFTPSSLLASGIQYRTQVNASAKDASNPGNAMASPASANFTTTDSSPPVISAASAAPSLQEAGGRVNVSASVTDDGMVSGVWVEVTAPGGSLLGNFSARYDPGSGRYFYDAAYSRPGGYTYRIVARDAAGNWNSASGGFTIQDTTPPTIQHTPVTQGVKDTPIRIVATISDVDSVSQARIDYADVLGSPFNVSMALNGSVYDYRIPGQPQLGTLTYFLWAVDPTGNAARTPLYSVNIVGSDTTPPAISSAAASPPIQNATGSVNISAVVTDNIGVSIVRVQILDPASQLLGNFTMVRAGSSDTYYDERAHSTLGRYDYVIWATDDSFNNASSAGFFEIVDMVAPSIQGVVAAPSTVEAGQSVNVSATVTDNVALATVRILIRDESGSSIVDGPMSAVVDSYYLEATLRTLGNLTFVITATDTSGNVATETGNLTVVDTQPPVAVAGPNLEVWIGTVVILNATGSYDNSGIANYSWTFTYNGSTVALYGSLNSFQFDAAGVYAVNLTVVDLGGLAGTAVLQVTVTSDTSPPPSPRNLSIIPIAAACLEITWEASSAPDLAGYEVFRWNQTRLSFDLIASLDAGVTQYTDCGLADDTIYSYWVVAYDTSGNSSPPSPIGNGRTSGPEVQVESLAWLYQAMILALLVACVILAALWAGTRKKSPPPQQPPPGVG